MIRSPGSKAEKVNWREKEALTDHDEDADALVGVVGGSWDAPRMKEEAL